MSSQNFMNMKNARTPEQQELMERIIKDGVCPFCKENFAKYHPKPILKETEYWFFTENISPYKGTKYHFLFVYKPKHVSKIQDILPEAFVDLFNLIQEAITEYKMPGAAMFMRFGDMRYTGSSVEHLHPQLIMGDHDDPSHEPVRVKLG
jgi:ATP adenylyltransferase